MFGKAARLGVRSVPLMYRVNRELTDNRIGSLLFIHPGTFIRITPLAPVLGIPDVVSQQNRILLVGWQFCEIHYVVSSPDDSKVG